MSSVFFTVMTGHNDTLSKKITHHDRNVICDGQDFRPVQDLCLELGSGKVKQIRQDSINNKVLVGADFVARECGNAIDQKCCRSFNVSFQKTLKTSVHLETISTIPVSTATFCGKLLSLSCARAFKGLLM
jgi:hypothetical protein